MVKLIDKAEFFVSQSVALFFREARYVGTGNEDASAVKGVESPGGV